MLERPQVIAKQQYAQDLAAYTLMQWNVARGAGQPHPATQATSSSPPADPSPVRRKSSGSASGTSSEDSSAS
ncbi:hypothetical protein BKA62DRAFT_767864 [Auriculariales sp. MPI-PUGE-AT-0066]|nr:hypothetical protein BKA62DRAFT_767864 [Auriculariales sp. MPI-PUGE-AT-0066]